jgi:general stress protein YciG
MRDIGRKGGRTVREKYGPAFFAAIGKKGGDALKTEAAPDHYSHLGKQGGQVTKTKYGADFYRRIGKKGGAALKAARGPAYYQDLAKQGVLASQHARQRKATLLPAGGSSEGKARSAHKTRSAEDQLQLAKERQALLAALPPTTHVSFKPHHGASSHQCYWYASWRDKETNKSSTLYLGKTPPTEHPCWLGQCQHPFRHGQPKKLTGRGGPPIGHRPSPEAIERMRQAHLGKSNRSRKEA